jgi:hypothetical protein
MCFLIFKLAAILKNILYPFPLLINDHVFAALIYWAEYCQLHQDAKNCEHTVSIFGFCGFFYMFAAPIHLWKMVNSNNKTGAL